MTSLDAHVRVPDLPRVLIVDDDVGLLASLDLALTRRGLTVVTANDPGQALRHIDGDPGLDLIVLDVMMPGIDGVTLCRLLRRDTAIPVLMLSARDAVADRITGLEAGADDYLAKPFDLDELAARLLALHRRNRHAHDTSSDRYLRYGDLELDLKSWVARRAGHPVPLTLTEFRILELLMQTPEAVWMRERLMSEIWGDHSLELASNSLEAHIANLRRKLERLVTSRLVHTVRGVGYVLRLEL